MVKHQILPVTKLVIIGTAYRSLVVSLLLKEVYQ